MGDTETAPKRDRKLKFSRILIALLLIAVCAFVVFRLSVRSKLRARIEAIRDAGYPVTLAELNEWYTIPEGAENAADTLIDAFLCYYEWNRTKLESLPIVGKGKLPARTEPLSEETKRLVAKYLADNQQALELLHTAAPIEHSRYPVDFTVGLGYLMYHFSDLRKGAQLLKLEAVLHAENNKPQLAARSVASIFGIARSLAKEPTFISQLVCTACQGLAISSLERVVNRAEFTDEQLVKFTQTVSNAEDLLAMSWAFAGERCMGISIFKNPASLSSESVGKKMLPAPILELYKALGLSDRDAIIYLDLMNDYMETTQLPLHQRQRAASTIEAKLEATSKIHILLHEFMPAFSRVITINIRSIAQLRAARVALAIQRYRLVNDNIPDTLTELVPTYLETIPKDPFDGSELRYRKLESGFVVYSVSEDGRDDGGKERLPFGERKKASSTWDITFIVER
ncbi:MAG: hypothetical protein HQ580_06975 [Planctomycetes bacterium]|nr:hypothetical protein [Planctomycetota bacterium]